MSLVIGCDTGSLGLDDIFRLISGIDVDGNTYIRLCDDETPAIDLSNLDCTDTASMLDILRGALFLNDDGEYCLNVSSALALPPFCATYQTIYNDLAGSGTPPSDAIAAEQNTMVCGLVDDGVWAKLDVFYCFAQTTNVGGEALMNWVTSGLFNATAVHAPVFTSLEGFLGDGANDYINLNWNPTADGINFVQNSASFGIYVRTNVDENSWNGASSVGADYFVIRPRVSNTMQGIANAATWIAPANTDSRGLFIMNRPDAATQQIFKNKVKTEAAVASTGLTNNEFYVLAYNPTGSPTSFSTRQIAMAFAGGSLTQTDVDNMTDRFEAYMDSNGKGVIP